MLFLIQYDRSSGTILKLRKFEDSLRQVAQDARLDLELALKRKGIQHEVVILDAPNEEALRHTHSRYFQTLAELVSTSTASAPNKDGH